VVLGASSDNIHNYGTISVVSGDGEPGGGIYVFVDSSATFVKGNVDGILLEDRTGLSYDNFIFAGGAGGGGGGGGASAIKAFPTTADFDAPITVDFNDIPIYEPQDPCGPAPEGPTDGQLLVSFGIKPTPDTFTATVVIDPNLEGDGPHEDFIFSDSNSTNPNGTITLTFTEANWYIPQNVYVEATTDTLREGDEFYPIELGITIDPCTPGTMVKNTAIGVVDNDIPYISVLPDDPCRPLVGTLSENTPGVSVYVNVTLSHKPAHNVEVRGELVSDYDLIYEMVVMNPNFEDWTEPNCLTFTPGNYSINQQICLTALDDDDELVEPWLEWVPGSIFFNARSDDIRYQSAEEGGELDEMEVLFEVQDNDCGAWGYADVDFNKNCKVEIYDFAHFCVQWLDCSDPNEPSSCESYL